MCPCGCGLEREAAIRMSTQFLGWSREKVEAAIKSSMDFLGWDRERAERAMDSFKVDK